MSSGRPGRARVPRPCSRSMPARSSSGCDAGGPSPYTPALEAAGIVVAAEHAAAHVTRQPAPGSTGRHQGPDRDRPGPSRAERRPGSRDRRWSRGSRSSPTPPSAGPWSAWPARMARARRPAGWSTCWSPRAPIPRPSSGPLLPSSLTGGPRGTARAGRGDAFVVEADEYAGNFDAYQPNVAILTSAEWDHPDVFADDAAVIAAFEAWLRRMPAGSTVVANVGDAGVETVLDRLRDWPGSIVAYALVDQAPQRIGGYARAIGERFTTSAGPASAILGRLTGQRPGLDHARDPRARPAGRADHDSAPDRRTPQRRECAGGRGRCRGPWHRAGRDRHASGDIRGHRPPSRAQGRGGRRRGL